MAKTIAELRAQARIQNGERLNASPVSPVEVKVPVVATIEVPVVVETPVVESVKIPVVKVVKTKEQKAEARKKWFSKLVPSKIKPDEVVDTIHSIIGEIDAIFAAEKEVVVKPVVEAVEPVVQTIKGFKDTGKPVKEISLSGMCPDFNKPMYDLSIKHNKKMPAISKYTSDDAMYPY